MAKARKIPLRKSVVSGEIIDKRDLLRIVKNKKEHLFGNAIHGIIESVDKIR